ncbi:MAG: PKD domain-containing protein, partial [Acidimicrobiales bacterium]
MTIVAIIAALVPFSMPEAAASGAAPTAVAGGPYSIAEGEALALDASGSSDPEADPLTYNWDLDNDGQYDDGSGVSAVVTWASLVGLGLDDDGGPFPVGLEVDDGTSTTIDTSLLTITNAEPTVTVTGPGTAAAGVGYSVTVGASDPGADTITSWTVTWGDGAATTTVGAPGVATHTYSVTGLTHDINVSVTDEDGTWLSDDLVTAYYDPTDKVSRHDADTGSKIADLDPTGGSLDTARQLTIGPDGLLYVSGRFSDTVERYDPSNNSYLGPFVTAGSGGLSGPKGLAFGPDGNLYVASSLTGEVLRYNGSTGTYIDAFVGAGSVSTPGVIAFGSDARLYVGGQTDHDIERFDAFTGAPLGTFTTLAAGSTPNGITWGPDGNLFVSLHTNGEVQEFDGSTGTLLGVFATTGLANAGGITFGADGALWVSDEGGDNIRRYDGTTGADLGVRISEPPLAGPMDLVFLPAHQVAVLPGIEVNSTGDSTDAAPGDGACDTGGLNSAADTECTLRAAIEEANALAGSNTIVFDLPTTEGGYVTGPPAHWTIRPASALPAVSDPATIDGYTQPGATAGSQIFPAAIDATLKIEVDGTLLAGTGTAGLVLSAGDSTVRGLAINDFTGGGAHALTVGGSGNSVVQGNYIGTDVGGTLDQGNDGYGIYINSTANLIGGGTPGAGNLVSANNSYGVRISGSDNRLEGNLVGTDATGTLPLGNSSSGIGIFTGTDIIVGGSNPGQGNLISASGIHGIWFNSSPNRVTVQGNRVGTDITGTAAVGNGAGILVNSPNSTIGGTAGGAGNLVSGNSGNGIGVTSLGAGTVVQGNLVGVDAGGSGPLGNGGAGVTASISGVTIGGAAPGAGNVVANSGGDNVAISGASARVSILGNEIRASGAAAGAVGIDLDLDGVTSNDAGDADSGPNDLLNFPVITSATESAGIITLTGTYDV